MAVPSSPSSARSIAGRPDSESSPPRRDRLWLLWGCAAGLLGFLATIVFDVRPWTEEDYLAGGVLAATAEDMSGLDPAGNRVGFLLGFAAVACLLIFQAYWAVRVSTAFPRSAASRVVTAGITASAAGLTFGYAWKGVLGLYGHGAPEFGSFDDQGLLVFYALTDFGAFIPWFGVLVSLAAMAWMSWTDHALSRIAGTLVGAATLLVAAGFLVTGVPGLAGPVAGLALAFVSLWMLVGRRGAGASAQ